MTSPKIEMLLGQHGVRKALTEAVLQRMRFDCDQLLKAIDESAKSESGPKVRPMRDRLRFLDEKLASLEEAYGVERS